MDLESGVWTVSEHGDDGNDCINKASQHGVGLKELKDVCIARGIWGKALAD